MTEQQTPKLMGTIVEHQNEFIGLSTEDTQWAIQNPKEAIALCVKAITERLSLLDLVGTAEIPATDKFVAQNKFVVDTSKAVVKIAWLGNNFKSWFLDKIEEPAAKSEICYYKLLKPSRNESIIVALGGKEKAETTLAVLFVLLEKQGNGEDGVLLTSGYANIFYIHDVNGVLRAVRARCHGDGWDVHAHSVENPHRWNQGYQVFSRNS